MHHIISSRVAVGQTTRPQILPDSPVLCQLQWFRHVASPADVMYGGEDKESERQNDSFQAPTNFLVTNQMYQPPTTHFTAITQVNLCLQCLCLQCFDAVGWAAGRASGL